MSDLKNSAHWLAFGQGLLPLCVCFAIFSFSPFTLSDSLCTFASFQQTYGDLDKDKSKSISLEEFVAYYASGTGGGREESAQVLVLEEGESQGPISGAKDQGEAPAPVPLVALFRKWSGAGQSGGKKAKSVDFKEFTEMLKALGLLPGQLSKHKAQEIFRQANRRPGDAAPDGDMSEMDFGEFEFAMNKVCEFCKIDPEDLKEAGS